MKNRPMAITSKRNAAIAGLLGALSLGLAGAALADHHVEKDRTGKYFWVDTATVVAVVPGEKTLRVTDALGDATYLVDAATLIRKGGDTIALADLEKGDRVAISAHEGQEVRDRPVADTITVVIVDPKTGEPRQRQAR